MIIVLMAGLVIGSFLNNVISYYCGFSKFDIKRSLCYYCNNKLSLFELIPLVSYILQRGKCKSCGSKISIRYPIVEIIVTIVLYSAYNIYTNVFYFTTYSIIALLLLIIAVVDFYKYRIPNKILMMLFILSLAKMIYESKIDYMSIMAAIIVSSMFLLINAVFMKVRKNNAIGFGDIKLIFILGLIFNCKMLLFGIWMSSLLAIPGYYIVKSKKEIRIIDNKVQFGSYIGIGFILIMFVQDAITVLVSSYLEL